MGIACRIESILKGYHPGKQIQISKGCGFYRRCIHAEQIIIVSGVSSGEIAVGTESFFMENGDLLPEGALRHNGQDRSGGILENTSVLLSSIGLDLARGSGSPGSKGTNFQSNHGQNRSFAEQLGISEIHRLRFMLVDLNFEIVGKQGLEIIG